MGVCVALMVILGDLIPARYAGMGIARIDPLATTAVALAAGLGYYVLATVSTALFLLILRSMKRLERS